LTGIAHDYQDEAPEACLAIFRPLRHIAVIPSRLLHALQAVA
jgi:hypothetical protein